MSFVSKFERRERTREGLNVAAQVQGRRRHSFGVARNRSEAGLLLACQEPFEPGDRVEVLLKVEGTTRRRAGRVVRSRLDLHDPWWPYLVAVALEPVTGSESESEVA